MAGFISTVLLLGRYPELARSDEFQVWLRACGGEFWHETHPSEDGYVTVVVQSLDRLQLYAAQLKRRTGEEVGEFHSEVVRTANIDLVRAGLTSRHALMNLSSVAPEATDRVQAVRPVVDFSEDPPRVRWEVELTADGRLERFAVGRGDEVELLDAFTLDMLYTERFRPPEPLRLPGNDWLEENELHHLSDLRAEALDIAGGAVTIREQALKVFFHVRDNYAYDSTINDIEKFTWSDLLVRFQLMRRGICDELAVVQVSFLRALGIPAALKFLHFTVGGQEGAHACLEFLDGGQWIHMDAYNRVLNQPGIYRLLGWKNITVMDASWPRDDRSTAAAWGVPDITGDGKLNSYDDFILSPSYPGERRPGYSY
jgi:transglutaminase-like putative cysteine protease